MQSVTLIGPNCDGFSKGLAAVKSIYRYAEQQFASGAVAAFEPPSAVDQPAFRPQTRYLTPSHGPTPWVDVSIPQVIDPHGILEAFVKSKHYRFTDDNLVTFHECQSSYAEEYVIAFVLTSSPNAQLLRTARPWPSVHWIRRVFALVIWLSWG